MYNESEFLKFVKGWKNYNGRRFFTTDGSSSYGRAKDTYEAMLSELDDGRYQITPKVAIVPDYFPILTDCLDDGLIYEMGFTLVMGESEMGRISNYKVERPNYMVIDVPDMKVVVRIHGLHIAKGRLRDGREGQEASVLHLEHVP